MRPTSPYIAAALLLALAACDVPTEAPILEQRWVLPVENTTIPVGDFLPDDVLEAGGVFRVEVDPFTTRLTLAEMCSVCVALDGQVFPKPGFTTQFQESQELPGDVVGLAVSSGQLQLDIRNTLGFDPIRPGGDPGTMTLSLRDGIGGPVVAAVVLDGADDALPDGSTTTTSMDLAGVEVGGTVELLVEVTSPAGDPIQIDSDGALEVDATTGTVDASSATVEATGRTVDIDRVEVDVEDVDEVIRDRIEDGTLLLEIQNPFGVAASGTLVIDYGSGDLTKPLSIASGGSTTSEIDYTGDELRTFLGQSSVALTGSATVDAGSGAISVAPGQELEIEGNLAVTIRIGG